MTGGQVMANLLVYPVILHPEEHGYFVEVPDIKGGFTQGENMADAVEMAADMIGLMLEDVTDYPPASKLEEIVTTKGDVKTVVTVDMDEYSQNS